MVPYCQSLNRISLFVFLYNNPVSLSVLYLHNAVKHLPPRQKPKLSILLKTPPSPGLFSSFPNNRSLYKLNTALSTPTPTHYDNSDYSTHNPSPPTHPNAPCIPIHDQALTLRAPPLAQPYSPPRQILSRLQTTPQPQRLQSHLRAAAPHGPRPRFSQA